MASSAARWATRGAAILVTIAVSSCEVSADEMTRGRATTMCGSVLAYGDAHGRAPVSIEEVFGKMVLAYGGDPFRIKTESDQVSIVWATGAVNCTALDVRRTK